MAYAESTVSGSSGGQFRVWVNSIRTYYGSPGENFEEWRVEGGLKRIASGGRIWNNYNAASYTVQLGMNGVASSGRFNYDFGGGTGNLLSWGTGSTRVYRNSAGVGFGFTSRMDINLSNDPYLGSGWVTSRDDVNTRYRNATLTALSMHAGNIPATDEGPLWLEFSNPGGAAVKAFIEAPPGGSHRIYTSGNTGSRFNFPNLNGGSLTQALQQAYPNSNTGTMRIGIDSNISGYQTYDYRDVSYTIKNDEGQANPTYSNFTYVDENPVTVAITGSDQVLIQDNGNPSVPKSDLKVTIPVADKATANKYATMANYLVSIGSYSQTEPWSDTLDVVKDIGTVADVSGDQTLAVRAIDSRGNGTTVSKTVTILPYYSPGFYNNLRITYANDFDVDDGISVGLFNDQVLGSIAPMTLNGTDKNAITTASGLQYTLSKDGEAPSTTWTDIPFTLEAGTGIVTIDPAWLATSIEGRMNSMVADNTVRWYVLFKIQDKLETSYYEVAIDVGRPFFRIGADGRLYYKEIEFFRTFSGKASYHQPSNLIFGSNSSTGSGAGWTRSAISNYAGWSKLDNGTGALNDYWYTDMYLPAGLFQFVFYVYIGPNAGIIDLWIQDEEGVVVFAFDPLDLYNGTEVVQPIGTDVLPVEDGKTYRIYSLASSKRTTTPASTGYRNAVVAIIANRVGDVA